MGGIPWPDSHVQTKQTSKQVIVQRCGLNRDRKAALVHAPRPPAPAHRRSQYMWTLKMHVTRIRLQATSVWGLKLVVYGDVQADNNLEATLAFLRKHFHRAHLTLKQQHRRYQDTFIVVWGHIYSSSIYIYTHTYIHTYIYICIRQGTYTNTYNNNNI